MPKDLTLNFEINISDKEKGSNCLQHNIYTDFKIYEDILFHIVQNAIKFAKPSTRILIKVDYKSQKHPIYTGYLQTKFIDEGLGFNKDSALFNTFAF